MPDDIVKRLRRFERYGKYDLLGECWPERIVNPDGPEAADEIKRLRAEVEQMTQELDIARESHRREAHQRGVAERDAEAAERRVEKLLKVADALREGIRKAGVKREPALYSAVMKFDSVRAALAETEKD